MKRLHLTLSLTQFGRRREALANRLTSYLAGQTKVRTVAKLAGLMTTAIGLSTAAMDRRDRAATKIAQLQNAGQDVGALLFESAQGIWQGGLQSVRIDTLGLYRQKKKTAKSSRGSRPPKGTRLAAGLVSSMLSCNLTQTIVR
jgi:hypothetical protein